MSLQGDCSSSWAWVFAPRPGRNMLKLGLPTPHRGHSLSPSCVPCTHSEALRFVGIGNCVG